MYNINYSGLDSKVSVEGLTYNGNDQSPVVSIGGLDASQYDVEVISKTDAGAYEVKVTGKGTGEAAYAGERIVTWSIAKADPTKDELDITLPTDATFDTTQKKATVKVAEAVNGLGAITVKYTIKDESTYLETAPVNAGSYDVYADIAEGDNYNAKVLKVSSFDIAKSTPVKPVAPTVDEAKTTDSSITLNALDDGYTYEFSKDGSVWQDSNVFAGLNCNTEYNFYQRVKATDNTNTSEASEAVSAKTHKASIAQANVEIVGDTTFEYTGEAITPTVKVTLGETVLGSDQYTVSYASDAEDATDANKTIIPGTVTITVTAAEEGNYSGVVTAKVAYTITKAKPSYTKEPAAAEYLVYSAELQKLLKEDAVANGGAIKYSLSSDADFSDTIPSVTDAGTYTVYYMIEGDANHEDSDVKSVDVIIAPYAISNENVDFTPNSILIYNGIEQTMEVSATTKDGKTVTFTVVGDKATLVSEEGYILTITGNGNFSGTATYAYNIAKAEAPAIKPSTDMNAAVRENGKLSNVALIPNWEWENGDTALPTAVEATLLATAKYVGTDAGCYENTTVAITITMVSCDHINATEVIDKAATCTATGTKHMHCPDCGSDYESNTIPMLAHTTTHHQAVAATCHATGMKAYYSCSGCSNIFTDAAGTKTTTMAELETAIDPTNHDGQTEVRGKVDKTCTENGYTGDTYCLGCNEIKVAGNATIAGGHVKDAGTVTKAATCTEKGKKAFKCSECSTPMGEEDIAATGHTAVTDKAVAATCEADGKSEGSHCSVCKEVIKAQDTIKATGHVNKEVRNASTPTYLEEGYTGDEYCIDCGKKLSTGKSIPKEVLPVGENAVDEKKTGNYEITTFDDKKKEVSFDAPADKTQKTVSIPATVKIGDTTYKVTRVDDKAFKGNKKVTKVTLGSNITEIGKDAFNGANKLTTVTVGKNVTTIGNNAFKGCSSLKSVSLGTKVNKIGSNAFNGCKKMKTLTIKSTKLTSKNVSKNAFKGITKGTTIKVPKTKHKAYKKLFKSKGLSSKVTIKAI